MFSSRIPWIYEKNRLARALEHKRGSGRAVLDLTGSNPTSAGFEYPEDRIRQALVRGDILRYEPSPFGLLRARQSVSAYYGERVGPDRILLTASTSEAYSYLFKLLADPGDEVLVPRPSYPLFDYLAALESVRAVPYPLDYHAGWTLDTDAIRQALSSSTRAVIVVNPNNPTGSYLKSAELAELSAMCVANGIALIGDEVFADYAFAPDASRVSSLVDCTDVLSFSMSGLSKVCGLPQLKAGWIVVNGPDHLRVQALEGLELIADTFLSVSTPVQQALPELLTMRGDLQRQIKSRTASNLALIRELTAASSCRPLPVEGGWYVTLQLPRTRTEEDWALTLLRDDDVLIQPGYFFDFDREAFLVLSLLTPADIFEEGVRRILLRAGAAVNAK